MPTKEAIDAAEEMILSDEVYRLDTMWREAFREGDRVICKSLMPKMEKAKKRCMKVIRERFPGEFKQPGCFIDDILCKYR